MLASLTNAPVYITKVMSRISADVISESRRAGEGCSAFSLCRDFHSLNA